MTEIKPTTVAPPLTPAGLKAIDSLPTCDLVQLEKDCRAYRAHRAVQDEAKTAADTLQAKITAQVTQHGFVPTNAEKSRRLETTEFVATVTIGTSVDINDDKVTELELVMSQARVTKLFPQLFVRRVEYSLAATAAKVMESTRWPKRYAERITLLYALAFKTKPKAPGLSVESRAAVEERARQLAEKAAKKAKKGGK